MFMLQREGKDENIEKSNFMRNYRELRTECQDVP